jgi:hypothetical protein
MQGRALAVAVGVLVSVSTIASAAPSLLTVRHGRAIHVAIGGRTEDAFALRGAAGGWRLELAGAGAAGTLVLRDVTLGSAGPRTFELALAAGGVTLDDARFRPDHAYRVELRRGTAVVGSALIYLQPSKRRGPVVFDDRETAAPSSSGDELPTTDKGAL